MFRVAYERFLMLIHFNIMTHFPKKELSLIYDCTPNAVYLTSGRMSRHLFRSVKAKTSIW